MQLSINSGFAVSGSDVTGFKTLDCLSHVTGPTGLQLTGVLWSAC